MTTVRAVRIREPGDVDVLELGKVSLRDPGPGEVRVRVEAAGLNRADLMQRAGVYPAPPGVLPDVPGLEYAGVVEALGADSGFSKSEVRACADLNEEVQRFGPVVGRDELSMSVPRCDLLQSLGEPMHAIQGGRGRGRGEC